MTPERLAEIEADMRDDLELRIVAGQYLQELIAEVRRFDVVYRVCRENRGVLARHPQLYEICRAIGEVP